MANEKKTTSRPSRRSRGEQDEVDLQGRWEMRKRGWFSSFSRFLLLAIVLAMLVLPFTPYAGKIKRSINELVEKARSTKVVYRDVPKEVTVTKEGKVVVKEVIKEVEAPPPPLPSSFIPRKEVDVATLYNGITIETNLDSTEGTYASLERGDKDAFKVEFQLKIKVPKANSTLPELARVNEHLPKMLPGLESMLETGKVSGFYHKLYDLKTSNVQKNLTRLNKILDRHNFFDCETILELTHPSTKRRILLIQSDMDVVADGSDGDRMPVMSAGIYESDYYQPSTSYEWAKQGKTTNPLLAGWEGRLNAAKKEYNQKGLSAARNAELKSTMQNAEAIIRSLKTRSSLIAEKDPFIVLSLLFRGYPANHPHAPSMGDYAAVIHGDKIYPAICGDYGPTFKMGEASLMVAKKISEKATPYIRPESDLKVSYVIFPGTAEKPFGPPNLDHWHEKVAEYLKDAGGLGDGYTLYKWENPFPAKVEPAPTPAVVTPPVAETPGTTATPPATTEAPALPSATSGESSGGTPPPVQP